MTIPLNWYAVIFVVAAVASWGLTFSARRLALQIGYVALPDERKVHERVTPQSGGAAMFVALLVAWAVAATIPAFQPLFANNSEPIGLLLGAAAIFVVGLIDDFRDMSAPAKMAGQVLAATVLYFLGVTWFQFKLPLAGTVQLSSEWLAPADGDLGHRHHQRHQPHRRPRRPGRRGGGHRLGGARRLRPPPPAPGEPAPERHRAAGRRHHLRHLRGIPAPQLPPGPHLHG